MGTTLVPWEPKKLLQVPHEQTCGLQKTSRCDLWPCLRPPQICVESGAYTVQQYPILSSRISLVISEEVQETRQVLVVAQDIIWMFTHPLHQLRWELGIVSLENRCTPDWTNAEKVSISRIIKIIVDIWTHFFVLIILLCRTNLK